MVEPGTFGYTTNNLNQYTEISQQSAVGSQQLSYDLDGNLIEDNTFEYTGACPEPVEGTPKTA